MSEDPIVIAGAARTPMGSFQGELSGASASIQTASVLSLLPAASRARRLPAGTSSGHV